MAASHWQPNDDDSLLLEAQLGQYRLGDGIRGYRKPDSICLDLGDLIGTLDLALQLDLARGRAEGWAFQTSHRILIDRQRQMVTIENVPQPLEPDTLIDTPEGWCVDHMAAGRWLGIELLPDLTNAVITIKSAEKLPIEKALERQARDASFRPPDKVDLQALPQIEEPYRLWRPPVVDIAAALKAMDSGTGTQRVQRSFDIYAAGEALQLSTDLRLATNSKGRPTALRIKGYRNDAKSQLLGDFLASSAAIGDITSYSSSLVAQGTSGRGIAATNRPIDQPDVFDRTSLRGELPQGWDAELYRNDQLLQVTQPTADGRYEFVDIPLLFGFNRLEVVLYGPQGQIRRERKLFNIGRNMVSPGKLRYALSLSQDNHSLIPLTTAPTYRNDGWRMSAAFETGLDTRTNALLQLHSFEIDEKRYHFIEGGLRRSLGPMLLDMSGTIEGDAGHAASAKLVGAIGRTSIALESILSHHITTDRIDSDMTGKHSLAIDPSIKIGGERISFRLEALYTTYAISNDQIEFRPRASARLFGLNVTNQWQFYRTINPYGPDPALISRSSLLVSGRLGPIRLRGEGRWQFSGGSNGFEGATVVGEWSPDERQGWRSQIDYDRESTAASLSIGYIRRLDPIALSTTASMTSHGAATFSVNVSFSLSPDPTRGSMRMTSARQTLTGRVITHVFRDLNGDGLYQPGEPPEPNVELTVGQVQTDISTNAQGVALLDNLKPFRPNIIGINTGSIDDPLVRPAIPGTVLISRPGLSSRLNIPLAGASQIDGTLRRPDGRALAGLGLELVDAHGRVRATTRTEFDGFFLFEAVPSDQYRLRISPRETSAKLTINALAAIPVGHDPASIHLGNIDTENAR
jgi:hypothetical protein